MTMTLVTYIYIILHYYLYIAGSAQTLSSQQQQRGTSSTSNSGSSNGSKYLRGHLFTNQGATTLPANRPNTSKVRVLSILDKIRANSQENYASRPVSSTPQSIPNNSNREALIDAISLVEDNG